MIKTGIVIAAVRSQEAYDSAIESKALLIFDLDPDIADVEKKVQMAHKARKKLFVHIDLAKGIGKDESGLKYLKGIGIDGIISTRSSIVKAARACGLLTVQRFFAVDSQSVRSTMESVKTSKPDMVEIMPGTVYKVIENLKNTLDVPIIAGGLVQTKEEVKNALANGAKAVSTGIFELWQL